MVRFMDGKNILCEHQFHPSEFKVGQELALTDFKGRVLEVRVDEIDGIELRVSVLAEVPRREAVWKK